MLHTEVIFKSIFVPDNFGNRYLVCVFQSVTERQEEQDQNKSEAKEALESLEALKQVEVSPHVQMKISPILEWLQRQMRVHFKVMILVRHDRLKCYRR